MEASTFLAFCRRAQVPGAVVCVILLNRLERDQITSSHDELNTFEEKLIDVVIKVIQVAKIAEDGEIDHEP